MIGFQNFSFSPAFASENEVIPLITFSASYSCKDFFLNASSYGNH